MLTSIVLGVAQGARHSLEADHLAALSVLIGESRSVRRSAWLGAIWGLGHTLSLTGMSIALLGFGAALPTIADRIFMAAVGLLLVVLGVRSLLSTRHSPSSRPVRSPLQALVVGMIHGLAGSSALTAMVFVSLPTAGSRLLYITLFGLGSIVGMAAVSAAAGACLQRIERPWLMTSLRLLTGLASIAIGVSTVLDSAEP